MYNHVQILVYISQMSFFNCSRICRPGQRLQLGGEKCCYACVACSAQEYSYGNGQCFFYLKCVIYSYNYCLQGENRRILFFLHILYLCENLMLFHISAYIKNDCRCICSPIVLLFVAAKCFRSSSPILISDKHNQSKYRSIFMPCDAFN